jgi:hypothetical protein
MLNAIGRWLHQHGIYRYTKSQQVVHEGCRTSETIAFRCVRHCVRLRENRTTFEEAATTVTLRHHSMTEVAFIAEVSVRPGDVSREVLDCADPGDSRIRAGARRGGGVML